MKFDLAWGDGTMPLDVPDRNLLDALEPNDARPTQDFAAQLRQAAASAEEFLRGHHRVLVLVNDYTRPTPNSLALAGLAPLLAGRDIHCLVCLGTHRPPTAEERARIFGPDFLDRHAACVSDHDCRDRSRLFFKGRTSRGTDVWLNRELMWAEAVIAINSVEPHYFAGFTGGRKTFLPGVAAETTIAENHALVIEPGSETLRLAGNPVHEDMAEAARMIIRPVFSIQFVLDRNHDPYSVYYGDLEATLAAAALDSRAVYARPVRGRADIIVSVLKPPYDINFYQSQRAVELARPALADGGIHICVSACRGGVGNDDFVKVFAGCRAAADVIGCAADDRRFGWHKSARLARIMEAARLWTVVGVDDETVGRVFMRPFRTVRQALDAALAELGPDAKVYVIPDAGGVVPVFED
ncbi:MAG: nickel-dependent lactate racemase [bacterium]